MGYHGLVFFAISKCFRKAKGLGHGIWVNSSVWLDGNRS